MFQSAPPTEVRGDRCWNFDREQDFDVSIRSPHRSEGRLNGPIMLDNYISFNPLPPPK